MLKRYDKYFVIDYGNRKAKISIDRLKPAYTTIDNATNNTLFAGTPTTNEIEAKGDDDYNVNSNTENWIPITGDETQAQRTNPDNQNAASPNVPNLAGRQSRPIQKQCATASYLPKQDQEGWYAHRFAIIHLHPIIGTVRGVLWQHNQQNIFIK